jgi:hypothetical protein
MQLNFELVRYDDELNTFELDEKKYSIELDEEEEKTYELLKSSDMSLYNWLQESDFFKKYVKEEVCQDSESKKFAISDINGTSFIRFYFFKVTSGDSHYEYFMKLFNIHAESDWQDREDVGEEILGHLSTKRKELILKLG